MGIVTLSFLGGIWQIFFRLFYPEKNAARPLHHHHHHSFSRWRAVALSLGHRLVYFHIYEEVKNRPAFIVERS